VPAPQAAAMAHARWVVERVRGLIGRLRALRRWAPWAATGGAQARVSGQEAAPAAARGRRVRATGDASGAGSKQLSLGEAGSGRASMIRARLRRGVVAAQAGFLGLARASGPVMRRAGRALVAGMRGLGAGLVRQRALLFGLMHRSLWWGSLALLLIGGRIVVDPHAGGTLVEALPLFVGGFGLCAAAALLAASARIRWASWALGAGHAGLALLLWAVNA